MKKAPVEGVAASGQIRHVSTHCFMSRTKPKAARCKTSEHKFALAATSLPGGKHHWDPVVGASFILTRVYPNDVKSLPK